MPTVWVLVGYSREVACMAFIVKVLIFYSWPRPTDGTWNWINLWLERALGQFFFFPHLLCSNRFSLSTADLRVWLSHEVEIIESIVAGGNLPSLLRLFRDVRITTLERHLIEMTKPRSVVHAHIGYIVDESVGVWIEHLDWCRWLTYHHLRVGDVWLERTFLHFLDQNCFLRLLNLAVSLVLLVEKLFIAFLVVLTITAWHPLLWCRNVRVERLCILALPYRWLAGRLVTCLMRILLSVELLERQDEFADTPLVRLGKVRLNDFRSVC